jgi:hypothetical protein
MKGKDLERLPEGQRSNGAVKIYTQAELNTADSPGQVPADLLLYEGTRYEVATLDDWVTHGGFRKYIGTRVPR